MKKVLVIKTSSMGDIIHTLPALTDASKSGQFMFDWVVEEAFTDIPAWHSRVRKVIPVAWRRFRKAPVPMLKTGELRKFFKTLREEQYDYIIDAQGLIKSALITRCARGHRCGLDYSSAWESIASLAYQHKVAVAPHQHAITRMRQLFSQILGYPVPHSTPDYGLTLKREEQFHQDPYLVFIHGTTWTTKEWPEPYWIELASLARAHSLTVLIPWGNPLEKERAERIAKGSHAVVLPKQTLNQLAKLIAGAKGVVSVDTGLGHLAAALDRPTLSLYGPTDPHEIGTMGQDQKHLAADFACSPCRSRRCKLTGQEAAVFPACFTSLPPVLVWKQLNEAILLP